MSKTSQMAVSSPEQSMSMMLKWLWASLTISLPVHTHVLVSGLILSKLYASICWIINFTAHCPERQSFGTSHIKKDQSLLVKMFPPCLEASKPPH